jgi:tetratricopeptide (TPR) repeat protein
MKKTILFLALFFGTWLSGVCQVKMTETEITIPTYALGDPEPDPVFYLPTNSQGAQKRVYPYPMLDKLTDIKADKKYKALVLENEYVKLVVLPELGGRIYMAYDKTNDYNFFYYNQVIKPSLIGMNGAWISGGVEWNIPHHHRVSTFMPVDYKLVANPDSSKSIWVGEFEKRQGMKWSVGLTLYPDKSYIQTNIKLFNVTPLIQSLLIWANLAVQVNDNYQVVFPPDCHRAVFHAKVQFTDWPVSHQVYQGVDYTKGVDVSWWKNSAQPSSYFCWGSKMDFNAGIDHDKKSGTVLIADHYTSPGKKMWNWGKNDVSRLWDKILTDKDGPYIELMMGSYSDNQPDYSWVDPYDTRQSEMFYYPVKNLSSVKNADKNVALNTELNDGKLKIEVNATSAYEIKLIVTAGGNELRTINFAIDPKTPYETEITVDKSIKYEDIKVRLLDNTGKELLAFQQPVIKNEPEPATFTEPKDPKDISSIDDLFATGLRLEQFHNPKYNPLVYYREVYNRDSTSILNNTQLGIYWLKQYNDLEAEKYLRTAYNTVTARFTKPEYSEPVYYLGVCLMRQERYTEAYDLLQQAAWSLQWSSAAYYLCAQMDCLNGNYIKALVNIKKSIAANNNNIDALNLKCMIDYKTGDKKGLTKSLAASEDLDKLNFITSFLKFTTSGNDSALMNLLRDEPDNYLENASRFSQAGFYDEAISLLTLATKSTSARLMNNPMIRYYLAYNYALKNEIASANRNIAKASVLPVLNCFPHGDASILVLIKVLEINPTDSTANYLLGSIYCDTRPELALSLWLKAAKTNTKSAVLYRNIAFVYANHYKDIAHAIENIDKAIALNPNDPLYLEEADDYYGYVKLTAEKRLKLFTTHKNTTRLSDGAASREVTLLTYTGKLNEAIDILKHRHFHAFESASNNYHTLWTNVFILRGIEYLNHKKYTEAIADFNQVLIFPDNLEIVQDGNSEIALYYLGLAYKLSGDTSKANRYFTKSMGITEKGIWVGELSPDVLYSKYLSCLETGNKTKAEEYLAGMTELLKTYQNKMINSSVYTSSLEYYSTLKVEKANNEYLSALVSLANGNKTDAEVHYKSAKGINPFMIRIFIKE